MSPNCDCIAVLASMIADTSDLQSRTDTLSTPVLLSPEGEDDRPVVVICFESALTIEKVKEESSSGSETGGSDSESTEVEDVEK